MMNTKIKKLVSLPRVLAFAALAILILVSSRHPLDAQAVTQGYATDQTLQRGMLVQIKKSDGTKIEPVTQATEDRLHGVVVDANDAPVTLSNDGQKTFVATIGHYDVFVSNQNGAINAGDYIAVSAIDGIGMKASDKEKVVAGKALASFDGKAGAISTTTVKDSTGKDVSVSIGRILVDLSVSKNPNYRSPQANIPEFLQRAATAISGKPVPTVRIYLSLVVFLVATIIAGTLLYGGVRSAIISIGRNPLSKKSIIRGMMQVIITGFTIFISGIFGVYLLLKI